MIERVCANGRRRYRSREEAEQLAAEFEASGLTRREFCERNEVSLGALGRYVKRYRQQQAQPDGGQQWVAVEIGEDGAKGSGLSVVLRGGRRIAVERGFDTATLQQVVTVLEGI
jgi:hypothetical protein